MRWTRSFVLPVTLVAAGCALLGSAFAAETVSASGGQRTYKVYCANCHGVTAKGDGPIASSLTARPSDLTGLAARNGGAFPVDQVTDTPARREQVRRRIADLVEYLRSLQAPPSKG